MLAQRDVLRRRTILVANEQQAAWSLASAFGI
jgi:hypothetical protein